MSRSSNLPFPGIKIGKKTYKINKNESNDLVKIILVGAFYSVTHIFSLRFAYINILKLGSNCHKISRL